MVCAVSSVAIQPVAAQPPPAEKSPTEEQPAEKPGIESFGDGSLPEPTPPPPRATSLLPGRIFGPVLATGQLFLQGDEFGGMARLGYVPEDGWLRVVGGFARTDRVWDASLHGQIELPLVWKRALFVDLEGHIGAVEEREFRAPLELSGDVGGPIRLTDTDRVRWHAGFGMRKLLWGNDVSIGVEGVHISNPEAVLGEDTTCDEVFRDVTGCPGTIAPIGDAGTDIALTVKVRGGQLQQIDGLRLGEQSQMTLSTALSSDYENWWRFHFDQQEGDKMLVWLYSYIRMGLFAGGGLPYFRELQSGYDVISGMELLPGHPVGLRRATFGTYVQGEVVMAPRWLRFLGVRPGVGVQAGGALLWLRAVEDSAGRRFPPDDSGILEKLAGNLGLFARIGRGPFLIKAGVQTTAQSGERLFFIAQWTE